MTEFIQVMTTTDSEAAAARIAAALVERRLAACVQVGGPVRSHYRWQGRVETAQEWLCTIKARRTAFADVAAAVAELHPYDEPEIVAVPITAASAGYLGWLDESLAGPSTD